MKFAPAKCHTIKLTQGRSTNSYIYKMQGIDLSSVDSHPYLGVELSKDLKWTKHITKTVNKANRTLGVVRRNLGRCSREVKAAAYTILVRPTLEYASSVWDPHQKGLIKMIEKPQRAAARFVTRNYDRTSSVTEMMKQLNWPSLEQRRKEARLTLFHKAVNKEIAVTIPAYVEENRRWQRNINNIGYKHLYCNRDDYHMSFLPRTIREWNLLPTELAENKSPESFKKLLVKYYNNM